VKFSKAQNSANFHLIPELRFSEQNLTSFAGLLIFQALFKRLDLKRKLRNCFGHIGGTKCFGRHLVVLLLIVHIIIGFRKLSDVGYYRDDPLLMRLLGLRRLPGISTISRALSDAGFAGVVKLRELCRTLVINGLRRAAVDRITLDFDGSVLSTQKHAEGTAVGYNPKHRGARSYHPLFCTVAQTGQFFDLHHRPGNAHDSNGAPEFMSSCLSVIRAECPGALLESRLDGAFFKKEIMELLDDEKVEFTGTVPFSHMPQLKRMIENRERWCRIDSTWSFFEVSWKPRSWERKYRFILVRKKVKLQRKEPLQLDLFEPREFGYEYKVIVTNKRERARDVVLFHNGRGSQEGVIGEAKQCASLGYIPTFDLAANQVYSLCSMFAHNLAREIQMLARPPAARPHTKRSAAWTFRNLNTLRNCLINRAGRITHPQGKLVLAMSANPTTEKELLNFLTAITNQPNMNS
jgi:hypothetical protein